MCSKMCHIWHKCRNLYILSHKTCVWNKKQPNLTLQIKQNNGPTKQNLGLVIITNTTQTSTFTVLVSNTCMHKNGKIPTSCVPSTSTNINELNEIQFSSNFFLSEPLTLINIISFLYAMLFDQNMTGYQGISWPSQAKNLPLSLLFTLLMMLNIFSTEYCLVKSLSFGTFFWNGLERSVSTVPGCNNIHMIGSFFLANSTETVFDTVTI